MSTVTLRRAETLAERAERESLFCLEGDVSLGVFGVWRGRVGLPFALVCFGHGCGDCGIELLERAVVGGGGLQGSSGWLALFFLIMQQRSV